MLSCVHLFAVPWTVACQACLSMEFFRQEYWSELPFPTPGDLPDPGIKPTSPVSPVLAGRFFTTSALGEPLRIKSRVSKYGRIATKMNKQKNVNHRKQAHFRDQNNVSKNNTLI